MNISDIINKSSPLYKQKEMSKSEYKKLVDRNTELVDKMKDLQNIIDKAIKCLNYYTCNKEFLSVEEQELYEILKGENK